MDALNAALVVFTAELNQTAIPGTGRFDAAIFNYLHREPHRAYRMQFASTLPILLRTVATAEPGSFEAELRLAVDSGIPILEALAACWQVSQSALRCLIGTPAELIGSQWASRVHELAKIIDAIRPEDRPRRDPQAWCNFNVAVAVAERVFRRRAHNSPQALAWLREMVRPAQGSTEKDPGASLPANDLIAAIDRLHNGAIRAMLLELQRGARIGEEKAVRIAEHSFYDWLATKRPERLTKIAERFERVYAEACRAAATQEPALSAGSFWPLLPTDMLSKDGLRRINSLTSRRALELQGKALNQCIGGSLRESYAERCERGEVFLVAITALPEKAPCSTAAIEIVRSLGGRQYDLLINQHTGLNNSEPSEQCQRALDDLIVLSATEAFQQHLRKGVRVLRDAKRYSDAAAKKRRADRIRLTRSLRSALGRHVYVELVRKVKQAFAEREKQ